LPKVWHWTAPSSKLDFMMSSAHEKNCLIGAPVIVGKNKRWILPDIPTDPSFCDHWCIDDSHDYFHPYSEKKQLRRSNKRCYCLDTSVETPENT
jgi:hypothetical protein